MYSARKYGDVCPYCNTNLETSNIKYTTVNDIKNINIAKPEIVGM